MSNTQLFGGTCNAATSPPHVVPITSTFPTNKAIAQIFFNTNMDIASVTCTHSTLGALAVLVPLTSGSGQYASFEIDDLVAGDVSFQWVGGGLAQYCDVVAIEGAQTVATNATATGSGTSSVSVLSTGTATDHYAFCGQRYAAAIPVADAGDAELNSDLGEGIGASTIYESWADGDAANWEVTGGNVWTAVSYLITASSTQTLSSPTDPLTLDSTSNTVTATGFTGDLTSLTDQDSGYAYTVTDQTGGTVTFDAPPLTSITEVDGAVVTPPLGSVTLVGTYTPSDPDEVATVATTIALPVGYESVTLSGSSNVEGTVGYGLNDVHSVLPADGWVAIYPTATSTVDADGTVYFSESSVYYYMYNPTTYEMYAIQFVFTAGDSITPEQLSVLRLKLRLDITLDLHYDLKIPLRG